MNRATDYRADIDGMRAIAVIAVLVFHAYPHRLPGGFLGVDIFFAISGYLITGIIARGIDLQTFSLLVFYQRRIRRIYPALITVLIATLLAGLVVLTPTQMHQLGWHIMGAAFFIPNLLLWSEAGYFDVRSATKPLLHLWSLGVEEQFYIVWPVLLVVAHWLRLNRIWVMAIVLGASLIYSIHLGNHSPTAAFYSPFSRAWELAFGGILACSGPLFRSGRAKAVMAIIGACMTLIALTMANEATFSIAYIVLAVIGAGLLISAGSDNVISRYALSARPLVAIGLISYPLYLWHWPILVFARSEYEQIRSIATLLLLAAALVLAAFTYLRIERPVHSLHLNKIATGLFVSLLLLGFAGAATSRVDIRSLTYPAEMREILAYSSYYFRTPLVGTCWLYKPDQTYSDECDFKAVSFSPRIAIWGDSHAGRLEPGLSIAAQGKATITLFAADSCPPIRNFEKCSQFTDAALTAIIRNKPDIAILFARWSFYSKSYIDAPEADGLNFYLDALERSGIKVAIIGPFPEYPGNLPDVIYGQWVSDKSRGIPTDIPNMPKLVSTTTDKDLRSLARKRNIPYLSLVDLFCNNESCATSWSSRPSDLLSWDYGHLTTDAGKYIGGVIFRSNLLRTEILDRQSVHK